MCKIFANLQFLPYPGVVIDLAERRKTFDSLFRISLPFCEGDGQYGMTLEQDEGQGPSHHHQWTLPNQEIAESGYVVYNQSEADVSNPASAPGTSGTSGLLTSQETTVFFKGEDFAVVLITANNEEFTSLVDIQLIISSHR